MIAAIIFDFDGVILDSEPLHYKACCQVLAPLGLALSYDDYQKNYLGLSDKDMFPQLMRDKQYSISNEDIIKLIHQKAIAYTEIILHHPTLPIIDGFPEFLTNIAKKVKKIAICSGSTKNEINSALTKIAQGKLQTYFNTIVTSEDVSHGKPSPEGYLLTAQKMNVSPKHCLVIEDTPLGIEAAKAAGMQVIGLLTSYKNKYDLNTNKAVSNFNQLLQENLLNLI
ncbi:HAD-superfamily hydrolase [Legionella busanensis]|uniref:HAD-superfamily hydrolase n=1 Tax=Legionella busanensis TaxID=190655 RepID=A0A378JPL9_9GAMM|nr:HAD family phosphatase [Legionella busanensis]STX52628.1 HAD-superfamily hydrolase [Legionella busanensis]